MLFAVYPLSVILVYTLLIGIFYRGRSRINETFVECRRSPGLRRLVKLWFGLIIAVFLLAQGLRYPFLKYVLSKLAHPNGAFSNWHDFAHSAGLIILICSELILLFQWSHYLVQCWRGITRYRIPDVPPMQYPAPVVAVMVPACDEEPAVLRRSLSSIARLRYPNMQLWLVENSRKAELKKEANRIAKEYGIGILNVRNRGNKGRALNDAMKMLSPAPEYLVIFDADQQVAPEFLEQTVPILQTDENLAFVQTAQLYENADSTLVCRAAAQQETLHYDTILEGKGAVGLATCCGTNFIMRWKALEDVGGWDEKSISEDMATSFVMHLQGWRSVYVRRAYAVGLGPMTLSAYWKQHRRWALGGTTVLLQIFRTMWSGKPAKLRPAVAVEYLWSAGFYTMTIAMAVLATLPILLILFVRYGSGQGLVSIYHLRPLEWVYLSVYPLYATIMLFPFIHMKLRGYSLRNLLMVQGILANTVPIYLQSVIRGLLGRIPRYEITPKSQRRSAMSVWNKPQTYIFLGLIVTGSLLFHSVIHRTVSPMAWIVLFWCFFYTIAFGHFLIYTLMNEGLRPKVAPESEKLGADIPAVAVVAENVGVKETPAQR